METQQQKNLLIGDAHRILTYGLHRESGKHFQIDDILLDEQRLDKAVRMLYGREEPLERPHATRLERQIYEDIENGNVDEQLAEYFVCKVEQLGFRCVDELMFEMKGLEADLAKNIVFENYEECSEIEKQIDELCEAAEKND